MIWGGLDPEMQNSGYGGLTLGLENPLILVYVVGPGTNLPQVLK